MLLSGEKVCTRIDLRALAQRFLIQPQVILSQYKAPRYDLISSGSSRNFEPATSGKGLRFLFSRGFYLDSIDLDRGLASLGEDTKRPPDVL